MTDLWNRLLGVSIAGRYPLEKLLTADLHSARFRTRIAGNGTPAVLALVLPGDGAEERLHRWEVAAQLSHPNLLRVFETGRSEAGDTPLVYAVTEYPEDQLADALAQRPLSSDEARDLAQALVQALSFLNSRGFVYGVLEPHNILAVDGSIKIAIDDLHLSGQPDSLTPADDVRSLGLCLYEAFTQGREVDATLLSRIPQPFQNIIRGCLRPASGERWTLAQIAAALAPPQEVAPAVVAPLAPEPSFRPAAVVPRKAVWPYVLAAVVLLAVIVWLAWPSPQTPQASLKRAEPPIPVVSPPPQPVPAAAPPAAVPQEPAESRIWRVIAYTYSRRKDAQRQLSRMRRRWPQLHAEIFTPEGGDATYFISLGGRMTYTEAVEMQRTALSKGLPEDVFVRNYSR